MRACDQCILGQSDSQVLNVSLESRRLESRRSVFALQQDQYGPLISQGLERKGEPAVDSPVPRSTMGEVQTNQSPSDGFQPRSNY
jgi:hypothetical protein